MMDDNSCFERTQVDDRTIAADTSYIVLAQEGQERDLSYDIYSGHLAMLRDIAARTNNILPVGVLETVRSPRDSFQSRRLEYTALTPTGYHTTRLMVGKEWPHLRRLLDSDGTEGLVLPKKEIRVYGQVRTGQHPLLARQLASKMGGEVVEHQDFYVVQGYRLR